MQRKLRLKFILMAFVIILIILFMALPMFEMKTEKCLDVIETAKNVLEGLEE